jgi:hypothetical protein
MKQVASSLAIGTCLLLSSIGAAFATGQPGAPGVTCGSPGATATPGAAVGAFGSPFNPSGQAGAVYAGNPGTASQTHAGSSNAISQYDTACFHVTKQVP